MRWATVDRGLMVALERSREAVSNSEDINSDDT